MDGQVIAYEEAVNCTLSALPPLCKLDDDILEQGVVEKSLSEWKDKAYMDHYDTLSPALGPIHGKEFHLFAYLPA